MKLELALFGYGVAGDGSQVLPERRRAAVQAAGSARGGGRLPRLALELARLALGPRSTGASTGVFFGTAYGCLTETESFVANMIRSQEATPKPRAFTASVHNAIASFVALDLGARGECNTFVHGEVSFAEALLAAALCARRGGGPLLVGAVDEAPQLTFLELARAAGCGLAAENGAEEGGAVLVAGGAEAFPEPAAIWLESIALARPADPLAWARAELRGAPAEALLCPPAEHARARGAEPTWITIPARHPSSLATTTAVAFGLLAGEVEPGALELSRRPASVAVLGTSTHGDAALLTLRRR